MKTLLKRLRAFRQNSKSAASIVIDLKIWVGEVKVNKNAFGTIGFGYPKISGVHASPSKTGSNSEPVDSVPCINTIPSRITDTSTDVEKLALTLAPNPANDLVKVSFLGIENGDVLISVYGMDGKMIDMIYRGQVESGLVFQMDYSTSHLSPGLYILNFQSEGVNDSKRLMIVR